MNVWYATMFEALGVALGPLWQLTDSFFFFNESQLYFNVCSLFFNQNPIKQLVPIIYDGSTSLNASVHLA